MEHDAAHAAATGWGLGSDEHPAWPPLGPADGLPDALAETLRREARRPRGECEEFLEDVLFVRRIPADAGPGAVRLAFVLDDLSGIEPAFDEGDALARSLETAGVPCFVEHFWVDELRIAWFNGDPEVVGLHRFGRSLRRDAAVATEQAVLQVPRPDWVHAALEEARAAATAFAAALDAYGSEEGGPGEEDVWTDPDGEGWSRYTIGFALPRTVSRLVRLLEAKGGRTEDWRLPLDESAALDLALSQEDRDVLRSIERWGPAALPVVPGSLPFERAAREPFERLIGLALRMHSHLRPMDPEPAEAGIEDALDRRIAEAAAVVRRGNRRALFERAPEQAGSGDAVDGDEPLVDRSPRSPCPCGSGRRWRNCCGLA